MKINADAIPMIATILLALVIVLLALEPTTSPECVIAEVVDKYEEDLSTKMVVDTGASIEKFNVSDEDYYRRAIGDEVHICKYQGKYTHISFGWRIE